MRQDEERVRRRHDVLMLAGAVAAVLFMLGLFLWYRRENNHVTVRSIGEFTIGDSKEIQYCIEQEGLSSSDDYRVDGWFVRTGVTYEVFNVGMMQWLTGVYNNNHLCYVRDGSVYELPTRLELREDVNSTLGDGIDYHYSGFHARVPARELDIMEGAVMGMIAESPDHEETLYLLEQGEN